MNYADFSEIAGWTLCPRSNEDMIRTSTNIFVNKMTGFHKDRICAEVVHTDLLGTRLHVCANILAELVEEGMWDMPPGGKWQTRYNIGLEQAFGEYKMWKRQRKIETKCNKFTVAQLSMGSLGDYPELKSKAYNCAMVSCWLFDIIKDDVSSADPHKKARAICARGFYEAWLVYSDPQYTRDSEGYSFELNDSGVSLLRKARHHAFTGYHYLSAEAAERSLARWPMKPKCH